MDQKYENTDQLVPRLATEWLNGNQHRAYPLDDSTAGNGLPTAFLIDALFFNSSTIDSLSLYISSIVQAGDNILVSMAGDVEGVSTDFGVVATVPFSTTMGAHVGIDKRGNNYHLSGVLVIGDTSCISSITPLLELTWDEGRLFPGCVRTKEESLLGIEVDGVVYSGIVTLVAGDGISFEVRDTDEGTEITVHNTNYAVPEEKNGIIVDDATLLRKAIELYGNPITTVCGVPPDADGNISFVVQNQNEQFVAASYVSDGAISLTIANDQVVTQCTDTSEQVTSLVESISNLNARSGEIHEGVQALDNAVSNLSLQVSRS